MAPRRLRRDQGSGPRLLKHYDTRKVVNRVQTNSRGALFEFTDGWGAPMDWFDGQSIRSISLPNGSDFILGETQVFGTVEIHPEYRPNQDPCGGIDAPTGYRTYLISEPLP